MVESNKVLSKNLTKNTKIVHFTQNIDILRRYVGEGQFPVGKPVDFIENIWYNFYKYKQIDNRILSYYNFEEQTQESIIIEWI